MIDKELIIKDFIKNFVLKDRRERSYWLLTDPEKRHKFTDFLHHRWDTILKMTLLVQISKSNDNEKDIQRLLRFNDNDLCYTISGDSDFDDQIVPFKEVFNRIYRNAWGTILINISADSLFLETEQMFGPAPRFIGHVSQKGTINPVK